MGICRLVTFLFFACLAMFCSARLLPFGYEDGPPSSDYPFHVYDQADTEWNFYSSTEECFLAQHQQGFNNFNDAYCSAVWDSITCWPATPAGHIVFMRCPPLRGLDPSRYSYRVCEPDGKWQGRPHAERTPMGWTNYTSCYKPASLRIYRKMFPQ